jgi:hypothetical protein
MASDLQSVVISKTIAPTLQKAESIAKRYVKRMYTHRETSISWRFRQRDDSDFIQDSFRSNNVKPGITLIYGELR